MKLNTMLLASAAALMATSAAFAADLPSKKAAPAAASVQVCKVGGMTGWTLPGSDTCINLGGWVRANFAYDLNAESGDGRSDWATWGGSYRLIVSAASNTEIGAVKSVVRLEDAALKKAYVQFGGLTAGKKDSLADIFGTDSINLGLWSQGSDGIDYQVAVGGLNFGIAAETAVNNNEDGTGVGDRPDLVAHLSGSAGAVSFALAAVSHEARYDGENTNGYAVLGRVSAKMDAFGVRVFGGMAENASGYIGGANCLGHDECSAYVDHENGEDLKSTVYGGGLYYTMGKTYLGVEAAKYTHSHPDFADTDVSEIAAFVTQQLAKNLSVTAEYYTAHADDNEGETENTDKFYIRIQRDF